MLVPIVSCSIRLACMSVYNIFDFITAGDWHCVAAVERLPALLYTIVTFCMR